MPFTSFSSGQTLTAAALNAALNGIAPIGAYKTSDETVSSNATVQNDDELFVTVSANKVYAVLWWTAWTCANTTSDFRQDFDGPTGATMVRTFYAQGTSASGNEGTVLTNLNTAMGTDDTRGGISGTLTGFGAGLLTMSSTAGTFRMRWAQSTSDASNTTVKAGSWMVLIPMN